MTIFLTILCVILIGLLVVSVTYNIRHGKIIIEMEDALEESLDVCDRTYNQIARVLEMPVAMATPEVKQILREIEHARDSILYVSNVLAKPYGGVIEEEANDIEDKKEKD